MLRRSRWLLVVLSLVAVNCGGDSPTAPSAPTVTGTWTGTLTSTSIPGLVATVSFTLAQSGSSVSGTWSSTGTFGPSGGTISGTISGSAVSVTASQSDPTLCPLSVTAVVSGSQMTGTYATFNCTEVITGSLSVTKS